MGFHYVVLWGTNGRNFGPKFALIRPGVPSITPYLTCESPLSTKMNSYGHISCLRRSVNIFRWVWFVWCVWCVCALSAVSECVCLCVWVSVCVSVCYVCAMGLGVRMYQKNSKNFRSVRFEIKNVVLRPCVRFSQSSFSQTAFIFHQKTHIHYNAP